MHRKNETATSKSSAQDTINDLFQCKFERKFCIQQTPRFVTLCFLCNYSSIFLTNSMNDTICTDFALYN
ncbi:hypothetical protein T09_2518 [Trichinella sp. T9]|uniref:Uncharacterized protein n=1 Tax=Trichinella murrelli TaxID=144512 RepID=A0A0V0U195_9BILA|nr:hypothetical protein T05_15889 [Trichinella murrelli]KRX56949.1 hypothetical protein T09_2518 [Trichinella sp. T9]